MERVEEREGRLENPRPARARPQAQAHSLRRSSRRSPSCAARLNYFLLPAAPALREEDTGQALHCRRARRGRGDRRERASEHGMEVKRRIR